jgi:hypothetical protein
VFTNDLAEWTGLEPATPGVTGRYSNQLNYHSAVVGASRLAPQVLPNLFTFFAGVQRVPTG